jgi:hypothetical protein
VIKKAGRLLLALTVLATLAAGYYGWRYWQLTHDGAATVALSVQVDRRSITGRNSTGLPYRYTAAYTFADPGGNVRNGRQTIDRGLYEELGKRAADAPVVVYYSRSKPRVNAIDPHASRNVAIILGGIALLGWGIVLSRKLSG